MNMTTPNYDFRKDFPIARKTEAQIAQYLSEKQNMKFLGECNNSDYDIRMETPSGKKITIEIKEDFSCARTGNVGVEYECRGRASGIEVSKADFYIYKVHQPDGKKGVYVIQTPQLKRMIEDKEYFRTVVGGDPGSFSKNYLFKLDVIKSNFKFLGYLES
jgi:hypothetical protein